MIKLTRSYWLLECNDESGIPKREIGIDDQARVILIRQCLKSKPRKAVFFFEDTDILYQVAFMLC